MPQSPPFEPEPADKGLPTAAQPDDNPSMSSQSFGGRIDIQTVPGGKSYPTIRNSQSKLSGLLINFVLPVALIAAAFGIASLFGTVENAKRPSLDDSRLGRLKSLQPVRIEPLRTLKETGRKLTLAVDGTVVPFREANVAAEVAGRVVEKSDKCEAGQYVRKGELLMKIDATDYELEVERLSKQKEQAYQAIRELDQEVVNTNKLIDVAKQDVDLQRKELERQQSLPSGFASRKEIDQANRAVLSATQQLVTVQNQYDLLAKRRASLEAAEQLAATQLRAAQINLDRTEIVAPIDGVIVREEADLNTFVSRGATLVIIDDTSKAEIASSLRMDQLYWVLDQARKDRTSSGAIAKQQIEGAQSYDLPATPAIIEYSVSGRPGLVYRWKGELLSYNGIGLDRDTRTVPVRVVVDNPRQLVDASGNPVTTQSAAAIVRGMYVEVKLQITPTTPLVIVPANALQPGNRVMEFIPDDTVLDESMMDQEDIDDGLANVIKDPDEPESETEESDPIIEEVFEPSEWIAGRVLMKRNVTPVDSLSVKEVEDPGTGMLWVCEVADQSLGGESWVVISPLGGLGEQAMPARARKYETEADDPGIEQSAETTKIDRLENRGVAEVVSVDVGALGLASLTVGSVGGSER